MFKTQLEMVLETAAGFPPPPALFSSERPLPFSESKPSLLFHQPLSIGFDETIDKVIL